MTAANMIEHALAYASAGIPVLPLLPRQKLPACAHGKDDATIDRDRICWWWTERPECNIGIRPPHGLVVLDVDTQHGGPKSMAALFDRYGPLPSTWMARTGQGGQHIWLRADGPYRGKLAPGVDIKTNTGYLVAAPSIHPNGNRYEWLNANPIAYAPAWLQPMIEPPPPLRRLVRRSHEARPFMSDGLVNAVRHAPEGNRNHVLYWALLRSMEEGTYDRLCDDLIASAIANGLTETEVENTRKSAQERGFHV